MATNTHQQLTTNGEAGGGRGGRRFGGLILSIRAVHQIYFDVLTFAQVDRVYRGVGQNLEYRSVFLPEMLNFSTVNSSVLETLSEYCHVGKPQE